MIDLVFIRESTVSSSTKMAWLVDLVGGTLLFDTRSSRPAVTCPMIRRKIRLRDEHKTLPYQMISKHQALDRSSYWMPTGHILNLAG